MGGFWIKFSLFTSRLFTDEPRTESFREDYEIAQTFGDDEEKRNHFYSSITAACESGWVVLRCKNIDQFLGFGFH